MTMTDIMFVITDFPSKSCIQVRIIHNGRGLILETRLKTLLESVTKTERTGAEKGEVYSGRNASRPIY